MWVQNITWNIWLDVTWSKLISLCKLGRKSAYSNCVIFREGIDFYMKCVGREVFVYVFEIISMSTLIDEIFANQLNIATMGSLTKITDKKLTELNLVSGVFTSASRLLFFSLHTLVNFRNL
jgi:hypothetical protein